MHRASRWFTERDPLDLKDAKALLSEWRHEHAADAADCGTAGEDRPERCAPASANDIDVSVLGHLTFRAPPGSYFGKRGPGVALRAGSNGPGRLARALPAIARFEQ